MEEKVDYYINFYNESLTRMKSLVKSYHDKRNKFEDLTTNEYNSMLVLEAEIQQTSEFVEDLKYIKESKAMNYDTTTVYSKGDKILFNSMNYKSNKDNNMNHIPKCDIEELTNIEIRENLWWILD